MAGETLCRGQAGRGPERDRGVAQPVRRDILRKAGALRGIAHDAFRGPDRHSIRAVSVFLTGHKERRILVLARRQIALQPPASTSGEVRASVTVALAEDSDLVDDADAVR